MALHVVQSTQQFVALRDSWDSLTTEPLLSFDWNYEWWKNFGRSADLRVYCYEHNGEVVGIAPFFVDNWLGQKRLRLLGTGATATDYTQIIVKPEYQDRFTAVIAKDIESENIKLLELEGVLGTTNDHLICDQLGDSFWRYDRQLEPTWVLELPDHWETFLRSTKKSLRRKIRKALKRIAEGKVRIRSTRDELDFEAAFNILKQLHQQRFRSKGYVGVFDDTKFTEFLKSAARSLCEKHRAEILVGEIDGTPIVSQFYLLGDAGPQLYQSGVRVDSMRYEPGHLLFTYAVRRAIESGCEKFDFLRGNEPYKSFWGAKPVSLYTIRCVSNGLTSTLPHQVYRSLRRLKRNIQSFRSALKPSGAPS